MTKQYHFITQWQFEAPLSDVWQAIYDSENWPSWWKSVKSVKETVAGDARGIGSIRTYTLTSPMGYHLSFNILLTDREDLLLLQGAASGHLHGTGSWYFTEQEGVTYVECHWQVATTVKWMNWLSFLLAPVFRYNHDLVMRNGARGLARKLQARLLKY
jgi:hypothetical protein